MKDTIVVDLDGTLSNCIERQHLVMGKKRDYDAFHTRLGADTVNAWCRELMASFSDRDPDFRVVLVSARPASTKLATLDWVKKHRLQYQFHDMFLLRAEGDSTPSLELKRAWLRQYGAARILFAIDDDPRNAAMFKAEGVTCLLAPGWSEPAKGMHAEQIEKLKAELAHYETEEEIEELLRP